jgi:hypothetical protein
VTTPSLPSSPEVQRRVAQAIGRSTYSWLPSRLLPMLPNAGIEKVVSCSSFDACYLHLSQRQSSQSSSSLADLHASLPL